MGAAPESIEFLRGMIETFNRSAAGLQEAYQALRVKFDQLNLRLEETNKNLSQSLAEQERLSNYLTSILESLSSGVLVVDTEGVITLFNRGAAEITGIPVEEAIGSRYGEIMGDGIPDELTPLGTIVTGKGVAQFEKTILNRSGEKIAAGYSISPLVNRYGNMMGAVEIFMDLSRIKALEDEISRMDKLAALGQMAATMAHKIRNPLGGIAGFTGLLELEMEESARAKRLTGKIMEGVDKLNRIVSSLVTYAAPPRLKTRPTDFGGFLREISEQYESEWRTRGTEALLSVVEPEGPITVEIDNEQFSDAAGRIVQNALEALDGAGKVTVYILKGDSRYTPACPLTAKLLDEVRNSSKLLDSRMPSAMAVITDNGCGMNEDEMGRLFVPFYTTKENGIGLGLAMARKTVEAHHGELWLVSREDAGASVGIVLPCVSTVASEPGV
ncbi:MAG: sensor histidine kinase [Candidatus Latescibacterota bacterium]